MSDKKIIKLSPKPAGFGEVDDELTADIFVSEMPVQHSHSYFEDEELGLYVGVWDTTDMVETAAPYSCDEFMTIIEGAVEIKNNKTGKVETVMAGESFVIPKDYDCQWQQNGYLRKFYVIYEPDEETDPAKPKCEHVIYIDKKSNTDAPVVTTKDGHIKQVLYKNNNQRFTAGIWNSKAFATDAMSFPYNEFIYINSGSLICTDEENIEHKFNSGDAVFIPQGTNCSWQVKNKVSIYYVQVS